MLDRCTWIKGCVRKHEARKKNTNLEKKKKSKGKRF